MTFRLPHPLVLLLGAVGVAAALTWVLPAGSYERRKDEATGREVVVAGTYKTVEAAPVGAMATIISVPRGIIAGADIILTILFVGGTFALLDATGALSRLVGGLVGRTTRPRLVVIAVTLAFAILGALENMQEEIVALIPVIVLLSRGLGFGAVTAIAMSVGGAAVGSAFGPTNPFQTGIALRFSGLPPLTIPALRFTLLGAALAVWIAWTLFMLRHDDQRDDRRDGQRDDPRDDQRDGVAAAKTEPPTGRDALLLCIAMFPFIPYVIGVLRFDYGFNELSAFFLVAGFAVGLVSGRDLTQTAAGYLKGMESMLAASLFVGIARSISIVMTDGKIIDTIIHGLATPLANFPGVAAALMMIPVQALLHIPVPSVSGQAVLTMPIMAPLADLLHVSRDAAVIAYQTGAGLMDLLTPTNGALLAILFSARVTYGRWMKFAIPGALLVALVGVAGVVLAS